jgi:hypothetical protein
VRPSVVSKRRSWRARGKRLGLLPGREIRYGIRHINENDVANDFKLLENSQEDQMEKSERLINYFMGILSF